MAQPRIVAKIVVEHNGLKKEAVQAFQNGANAPIMSMDAVHQPLALEVNITSSANKSRNIK